jgi:glycosyltransferase involved in cell wall biosynthesis
VINPSLFEGWSTTVEEAKSMGKALILSDIPTHREQTPARGHYFAPHDSECLAALLMLQWNRYDTNEEEDAIKAAGLLLKNRRRDFARRYEQIVLRFVKADVAIAAASC